MHRSNPFSKFVSAIVLLIAAIVITPAAQAHELRPSVADMTVTDDGSFAIAMRLNLEALLAGIGPEHEDTDDSPQAAIYDRYRAMEPDSLKAEFDRFAPRFLNAVAVENDGIAAQLDLLAIEVDSIGDVELTRESFVTLSGQLDGIDAVQFRWNAGFGPVVLRVDNGMGEEAYTAYLSSGESDVFAVAELQPKTLGQIIPEYIVIGFEHILPKGLDHILFVVGLFLLSTKLRPLLWQISAFTLAHTITLALGILGIVNIPGSIVEPLIAASITYVAIENIFTDGLSKSRPFVIFVFGLLHGLGFAGVLGEIGLSSEHFVAGLISFNVGVEIGQLTVIAMCFLAVGLWFGRKPWYRTFIVIPGSAMIALVGAYWFVERVWL